ncbi:MAG: S-adenosylmethionine decarboxylase [bacterium]|nr:S-adenosylmethionine decarboxylase [bacterium]
MENTSTLSSAIGNPSVKFSGAGNTKEKKIYGLELVLELFDCDLEKLTSIGRVEEFLDKLEKEGGLTRYGAPLIKRFMGGGHFGEGYSFLQFLSSSSISGHYIEPDRIAFINVFSCSMFDHKKVTQFCTKYFDAKKVKATPIIHKDI